MGASQSAPDDADEPPTDTSIRWLDGKGFELNVGSRVRMQYKRLEGGDNLW